MSDQPASLTPTPTGYADWLLDLKARIHSAQQRAALAVNRELVLLPAKLQTSLPSVVQIENELGGAEP